MKKILKGGKEIKFKDLVEMKFFEGPFMSSIVFKENCYKVLNNSELEILNGFKEYLKIQNNLSASKEQSNFKKNLPEIDLKYYNSNVAQSFLDNNRDYFSGML